MKKEKQFVPLSGISDVKKAVVRANNAVKAEAKAERKTLNATIAFIAGSEAPGLAEVRVWLGLDKLTGNAAAKKEIKRRAAAKVLRYAPYVCAVVHHAWQDGEEVISAISSAPCNSKGKPYTDYIDVVFEAKKAHDKDVVPRRELARRTWERRQRLINIGCWYGEDKTYMNNAIQTIKVCKVPKFKKITLDNVTREYVGDDIY